MLTWQVGPAVHLAHRTDPDPGDIGRIIGLGIRAVLLWVLPTTGTAGVDGAVDGEHVPADDRNVLLANGAGSVDGVAAVGHQTSTGFPPLPEHGS